MSETIAAMGGRLTGAFPGHKAAPLCLASRIVVRVAVVYSQSGPDGLGYNGAFVGQTVLTSTAH